MPVSQQYFKIYKFLKTYQYLFILTEKGVNYFDFEAWDSGAVALHKYCKKGDIIDVVTTARNNNWTDSKGNKKFQTKFRVKEFKLFNNNPSYQTSGSNAEKDEG